MITLQQIETALANGELWCAMRNGRFWRARRSGKTQTWKTRPSEFRIPIKAGMYAYGAITHSSRVAISGCLPLTTDAGADFVIAAVDPTDFVISAADPDPRHRR